MTFSRFTAILLLTSCALANPSWGMLQEDGHGITFAEVLRIGDESSGSTEIFGDIGSVNVDSKGRIYVEDASVPKVSVFSDSGQLLGAVGGKGEGPGEFEDVWSILIGHSDSVYVHDRRRSRLLVYAPETWEFRRHVDFELGDEMAVVSGVLGFSDLGPILHTSQGVTTRTVGDKRYESAIQASWSGQILHDLVKLPQAEHYHPVTERGIGFIPIPHLSHPRFRVGTGGRLYSGVSSDIEFTVTAPTGKTISSFSRPHVPVRVPRSDRDQIRNREAKQRVPEFKPAYRAFLLDDLDQIWIQDQIRDSTGPANQQVQVTNSSMLTLSWEVANESGLDEWLILDAAGELVEQVSLPTGLGLRKVIWSLDRAYGVSSDDSGAEYLIVYSLNP